MFRKQQARINQNATLNRRIRQLNLTLEYMRYKEICGRLFTPRLRRRPPLPAILRACARTGVRSYHLCAPHRLRMPRGSLHVAGGRTARAAQPAPFSRLHRVPTAANILPYRVRASGGYACVPVDVIHRYRSATITVIGYTTTTTPAAHTPSRRYLVSGFATHHAHC